jgi:hypothetical protein
MLFDRNYIIFLAILGVILLYSYYYLAVNDKRVMELWGRIKGNFLNLYYLSMVLSTIGFLLFFYYIVVSTSFKRSDINHMFIALLAIIVISMLWMPLSLKYLRNKGPLLMFLITFVLFLVAVSALYLIFVLDNVNESKYILNKNLALYGMIYFFIHASVFDLTLWSYNFF